METLILNAFIVLFFFIIALFFLGTFKEAYDMEGKSGIFLNIFGTIFFSWLAVMMIIGNYNFYKIDTKNMNEFTLEKYLRDTTQEVETRDRNPVKIIYTELDNPNYPIIGIVSRKNCNDSVNTYTKDGKVYLGEINGDDLFFAARKQTRWIFLYKYLNGGKYIVAPSVLYENKEDAEKDMKQDNGFGLTEIAWEE